MRKSMYSLQYGNEGYDWETCQTYPAEYLARDAMDKGDIADLLNFVPSDYGRYEFRLLNPDNLVIERWIPSEEGRPFIAMLSENPFSELQESYDLEDEDMINLCKRYLKAKGEID